MSDLDDRIRALVSAAVADAPPAPELDVATSRARQPQPSWTRRGAFALAALLAAGGGYAVLQPADDTDIDTKPGPATPTTLVAQSPESPSVIVTAGPNGVVERVGNETKTITTEPMAIALALDDGTFVAQRRSGESHREGIAWPKADTSVIRIDESGHISPLFEANAGFVILHDFAVVDGRRLLLYSVDDNNFSGLGEGGGEQLYALDLDSRDRPVDLGSIGGWEAETDRLSLGANGLIIGTSFGACCSNGNLLALAVPGSPAAAKPLPRTEDFGLGDDARFEDGCVCPSAYAVDADGTKLYWLGPTSDGTAWTVVSASFADPRRHTEVAPGSRFHESLRPRNIDPGARGVVVSFGTRFSDTSQPPVLVNGDSSTTLDGAIGTTG
ncbi:MAG: hypothetical protein QOI61_1580 [Actinomycetota bacterium]